MKRYMLTEPAYIGLALLAAGSIITEADLPEGPEMEPGHWEGDIENRQWVPSQPKEDGKLVRSKPPKSSIEVDKAGQPVNKRDIGKIAAAPAPDIAQPTGFVPGQPDPAPDAARAEQADQIADAAKAAATQPQRRGGGDAAKAADNKK